MEKKGARMLQTVVHEIARDDTWNIVELESRRQLRRAVQTLIDVTNNPLVTTSEIQQQLNEYIAMYGELFSKQLVRALRSDEAQQRQGAVWLLTVLNDEATIPLLQQMSRNRQYAREIRLSAALALAGMGATPEVAGYPYRERLYA